MGVNLTNSINSKAETLLVAPSAKATSRRASRKWQTHLGVAIYQWVILVAVLLFLFIPLLGMLIFSVRFLSLIHI